MFHILNNLWVKIDTVQQEIENRAFDEDEMDVRWYLKEVYMDVKAVSENWLKSEAENSTIKQSCGTIINFLTYDGGEDSFTSFIKRLKRMEKNTTLKTLFSGNAYSKITSKLQELGPPVKLKDMKRKELIELMRNFIDPLLGTGL